MEDTAQSPLAFKIMIFLEKVPAWLKKGPWSPVAHLVILAFLGYILLTYEYAVASRAEIYDVHSIHFAQNRQAQLGSKIWLQCYRLIGGIYMISITAFVVYMSGFWPLASYTITSWNLATIRLLASFVGRLNYGFSPHFQFIAGNDWSLILKMFYIINLSMLSFVNLTFYADVVRLPALIGCSITVIVWWTVLVPVISAYMPDGEARKKFGAFNKTFPLLNLHLFNLPLCAIEFLACERCLTYFDFWVSLAVAFLYIMFYLNVLDALGLHFYIVFTPRTAWCIIPYSMILLSYYGLYLGWNHILSYVRGLSCT